MNKQILVKNIKTIIKQVVKENLAAPEEPQDLKTEVKNGLKGLFNSIKDEYSIKFDEFANITTSLLAKYTTDHMNENNPKPAPSPGTNPGPGIAPGKPAQRPGPRRPLTPPHTTPSEKPKAGSEQSIVNKIEDRFKSLTK